jgi:acetylornithine deacetylase/succinyl-diaminopimelate desuccinylase-like protein
MPDRPRRTDPAVRAEEARELIEQLVAIESVNPTLVPGGRGEAELASFVAEWLDGHGVEVEYKQLTEARANVVGHVGRGGGGRTLLLNAHLDTVAVGGEDAGLVPRVEGNRLYGRGAYDMKGGLAAIMLTAAHLDRKLSGDLIVTAVADEEAHSIGTEAVVESLRADAAIVTEPTELRVAIAHKGFVWLELETKGVAAHGSRYDLGVDAIARMGPVLVGLGDLDERLRAESKPHPLLGGRSMHASMIEGGVELSSYPDRCLLKVERRTLPGEAAAVVEAQLAAVAEGAVVKTLFVRLPLETSRDEPIVQVLLEQASSTLGQSREAIGVPYWTDAGLLAAAGVPTVVFGPSGAGAHADVEWVDLDSVVRCVDVLLATARAFCR